MGKRDEEPKKEFTATEVMALVEHLEQKIDVIGEQYGSIQTKLGKLDTIEADIRQIKEDISVFKTSLKGKANREDLETLQAKVATLETKLS